MPNHTNLAPPPAPPHPKHQITSLLQPTSPHLSNTLPPIAFADTMHQGRDPVGPVNASYNYHRGHALELHQPMQHGGMQLVEDTRGGRRKRGSGGPDRHRPGMRNGAGGRIDEVVPPSGGPMVSEVRYQGSYDNHHHAYPLKYGHQAPPHPLPSSYGDNAPATYPQNPPPVPYPFNSFNGYGGEEHHRRAKQEGVLSHVPIPPIGSDHVGHHYAGMGGDASSHQVIASSAEHVEAERYEHMADGRHGDREEKLEPIIDLGHDDDGDNGGVPGYANEVFVAHSLFAQ
ncbi:hypothetical protein HK101_001106 [Irineochytrium annulatum]|nr:hypothetical protein HK101_001106 [Irineochytrium annulatum]